MKIDVKVKPDRSQCRFCLDLQEEYNQVESCAKCPMEKQGVMINTAHSFLLGHYAIVKYKDGTLAHVPLNRVKVIE